MFSVRTKIQELIWFSMDVKSTDVIMDGVASGNGFHQGRWILQLKDRLFSKLGLRHARPSSILHGIRQCVKTIN